MLQKGSCVANPSAKNETPSTTGYPRIERLIDTEDFDPVNKSFTEAYAELEKVARQKAGLGKAKQAKKAMRAYELSMELLKELLKLKYQMMEAFKQQEAQKK
ncbi:MAG: hypothetical protein JNK65_03655 [Deltaproteobacteria bacterium]|nr:hypothetical protein [Deltaproteobacteria bacterium]